MNLVLHILSTPDKYRGVHVPLHLYACQCGWCGEKKMMSAWLDFDETAAPVCAECRTMAEVACEVSR